MLQRIIPNKDSKTDPIPRLEPLYKLLKEEKYKEVADIIGYKTPQPITGRASPSWLPFTQLSASRESTQSNTPSKNYTTKEIGQLVTWLADNKIDFAKLFLKTPLGNILAKGVFVEHQSPILAALDNHPKFFEIIKHNEFPPEQIGNALYNWIAKEKNEKAIQLLRYFPGPSYDDNGDYCLNDHEGFNDKYGDNPARYYETTSGNRALHLACSNAMLDNKIINALIERGAFLTDRNKDKKTPLSILIDNRVNLIDFFNIHFGVLSEEHFCKLILDLSLRKLFDVAKHLIQKADASHIDLDLYYQDKSSGNTILHLATEQKTDIEFTQLVLLHTDKLSITQENKNKLTPFMLAIESGNDQAIKLFIDVGIHRKTQSLNGITYGDDKTPEMYSPQKEWAANNVPNTAQTEATYDFTPEHLGKAFMALLKANKLDLLLKLFEKRPDTQINITDPDTNNNIAHYAAISEKHPQKEQLFLLLCQHGVNLEKENKASDTPLKLLTDRKEYAILVALFIRFKTKFSLEALQKIAIDIIIGKDDLRYLPDYLAQVQAHPSKEIASKQEQTKRLLLTLIDKAKSEDDVKKICILLKKIEKEIPYFYPPSSFWNTTSITCANEVMKRAYDRIMEFSLPQTNALLFHSADAKEIELQIAPALAKK